MDFNAFARDRTLGRVTFEINGELVKETNGVYEATPNGIDG
jgi:hypothetical protein